MADNVEFLKHVRLFEDLDRKSLEAIANAAVEQSYTAGQDIVRQGDTGVGAFIIKKGRVEILASEERSLFSGGEPLKAAVKIRMALKQGFA